MAPATTTSNWRLSLNLQDNPPASLSYLQSYDKSSGGMRSPARRSYSRGGRFDHSSGCWVLSFRWGAEQPSLTQVCRETRHFMLRNGDFIFSTGPTESGLWWNPKVDTLLFTHKWDVRFEWNVLEGLRGLGNVKNVSIDQDLARWISFNPIYPEDVPEYDVGNITRGSRGHPVGVRFCCPDDSPSFKFFLFNGIHPGNLSVLFTRLLQDPNGGLDDDDFPDVRVDFDFLNDDLDEVKRKPARLGSLWAQSKQSPLDRHVIDMDYLLEETLDIPGPVFRRGASCEGEDEYVHASRLAFFKDMNQDYVPFF